MTWAITPRPVALVSTMSKEGVTNVRPILHWKIVRAKQISACLLQLAPISYFNEVNHDPPMIMISVVAGSTSNGLKDTANNIHDLKEFCVSIISEPLIEAANYSSINTPEEVDEYSLCGFTKRSSKSV
jgi:flavin reductase (DIM6/NTAB) family NADH-FMN oxidoreductase RutF